MALMRFNISSDVRKKLKTRHRVEESEIEECFLNREKGHLRDTRENHRTDPPTVWFVAKTDKGRLLKIVWMKDEVMGITIKSAFEPNKKEIEIYAEFA